MAARGRYAEMVTRQAGIGMDLFGGPERNGAEAESEIGSGLPAGTTLRSFLGGRSGGR
jgi:hypothetical protein